MKYTTLEEGLHQNEVIELQKTYGSNELSKEKKKTLFHKLMDVLKEPMFLLLIGAATIYFFLGEPTDGFIMLVFVVGIIAIEFIQEWKTDKTLEALKDLSAPKIQVIRDGTLQVIPSKELVPYDLMLISEGVKIPADGYVIKYNDLCIDESTLTGESVPVWKTKYREEERSDYFRKDYVYAGTMVIQGSAYIQVAKTGADSEYGKIGEHLRDVKVPLSPLQKQTKNIVKISAMIAAVAFVLVIVFTFIDLGASISLSERIIHSILAGITLAMALIPEEFPVVLTVFLSMGAWRLAKKNALIRRLPAVETLGSISVLCVDKTGTITMNQMEVEVFDGIDDESLKVMGLACEEEVIDPMEHALLRYIEKNNVDIKKHMMEYEQVFEYSFTNELKMMGHVWKIEDDYLLTVKGSAEKVLALCHLPKDEEQKIREKINTYASKGLRVLAIAKMQVTDPKTLPDSILECSLTYCGLVGLADPPRPEIEKAIQKCQKAGIRVVMITGDHGVTAQAIANKVGMEDSNQIITGDELDQMSPQELKEALKNVRIFSRVIPEHKLKIVQALQSIGEVVAMSGDGVNDAVALKQADIGIAMGLKGSEVAREAAAMILLDDNFTTIVETIADGRRIYNNIQKAIHYIFTIHIPIALAALCAPLLGIPSEALLFLPIHVVLLEIIIDPTCSIVLEREPAESNIMEQKPRDPTASIITGKSLLLSLMQGLMIFLFSFGTYYMVLMGGKDASVARTMGLVIIFFANIVLVATIASSVDPIYITFKKMIRDRVLWLINGTIVVVTLILVYSPLNQFFKLSALPFAAMAWVIFAAFASVIWYEGVKWLRRRALANLL